MASTITGLLGQEVTVGRTSGGAATGKLRAVDDRGILITNEDERQGAYRLFFPWAAVAWIKAMGDYKPQQMRAVKMR